MEYSDDYGRQFGNLAEQFFGSRIFPNELIQEWTYLIDEVKDGYGSIHVELDYDLSRVRGSIEMLLDQSALNVFP